MIHRTSDCFLHMDKKKGGQFESHPCHEGNTSYQIIKQEFGGKDQ
jgi:hypothetical protein